MKPLGQKTGVVNSTGVRQNHQSRDVRLFGKPPGVAWLSCINLFFWRLGLKVMLNHGHDLGFGHFVGRFQNN